MIKQWILVLMYIVVMFGWGTTAGAEVSVIDSLSDWGGGSVAWLGGSGDRQLVFAQTFTVPQDDYLISAEFVIDEYTDDYPGIPMFYNVYVMRWDGDHVSGAILYQSQNLATDGVNDNWQNVVLDDLALPLESAGSYVIFWGTSQHDQDPRPRAELGYGFTGGDVYTGGQHVFANSENMSGPLEFTELGWELHSDLDLAIRLTFIPEPASVSLLLISCMAVIGRRRNRR